MFNEGASGTGSEPAEDADLADPGRRAGPGPRPGRGPGAAPRLGRREDTEALFELPAVDPASGPPEPATAGEVPYGPERPDVRHSWRIDRDRAARRRRRPRPGSENAEQAYAQWVADVLEEVPAGWTADEKVADPQVRALRELSAQLPDADLALKAAAIDPGAVGDDVLKERLRANQRLMGWLAAEQANTVAAIIRRRSGAAALYVAEEVAACLSLSGNAAATLTDRAEALGELPEVAQALRAGRLDAHKTDVLIKGTESLPGGLARAVHRAVLPAAEAITAAQLRNRVATGVITVDPEQARDRHQKAKDTRTVSLTPANDGMAWISAFLPAPEAMAAFTAVDALAGRRSADDDRPVTARRADAFGQVFTEVLNSGYTPGGGPLGTRQGMRPRLVVTAGLSTLLGASETVAHLDGYGPIDAQTARELAGTLGAAHLALTGPDGALAHMQSPHGTRSTGRNGTGRNSTGSGRQSARAGRAHHPRAVIAAVAEAGAAVPVDYLEQAFGLLATDNYLPSAGLRSLIITRDRTCRFPGCEQPGSRCQIDHIEPFSNDLPAWAQTIETNLHLLCPRHHQMKTSGTWQVRRDSAGTTHWTAPGGQYYQRPTEVIDPEIQTQWFQEARAEVAEEFGDQFQALGPEPLEPGTAMWSNEPDPASNPQVHNRHHHQVTNPPGSTCAAEHADTTQPTSRLDHHRSPPSVAADAGEREDEEGSESDRPPFCEPHP